MSSIWKIGQSLHKANIGKTFQTLKNVCKPFKNYTTITTTPVVNTTTSTNTQVMNRRIGIWLAGCSGMVAGINWIKYFMNFVIEI